MSVNNIIENLIAFNKSKKLSSDGLKRYFEYEITDHVYNTNAIEGSTLTFRETDLVINKGITVSGKRISELDEAIGTKNAFNFVLNSLDLNLNFEIIKKINGLVRFKQPILATYREENVRIAGSRVILPNYLKVESLINSYILEYNDTFNKYDLINNPESIKEFIKDLSLYHIKFERIHPFIDGNGRTGRLILNFEMLRKKLLPINIKFEDRENYYKAFENYDSNGDISLMEKIVEESINNSLTKYLDLVNEKVRRLKWLLIC